MLRKYEGMFLFDPAAATDWAHVERELARLMERAEARIIVSTKWDERRLAYEIRGHKRGMYALTYFEAEPDKIVSLKRDAELSESILRYLVVRADHLTDEEMREEAARRPEPGSSDSWRPGGHWGGPDAGAREEVPAGGDGHRHRRSRSRSESGGRHARTPEAEDHVGRATDEPASPVENKGPDPDAQDQTSPAEE